MKFHISRTSDGIDEMQPHEKAYKDKYIHIDSRYTDDSNKLNHKEDRDNWYNKGNNHRVENGHIKRDFQEESWFIDIDSLKELIDFLNEVGSIVVTKFIWNEDIPEIEIYDDYRE